jgi:hypothetical protein
MTLDTCSFVVDVCCGFWLHCCLDVAVSLLLMFVVVVGFIIFSLFLLLRLLWLLDSLSSVLLMFVGFCGLHCSFYVVVTLLLMSVLVGSVIIDTP